MSNFDPRQFEEFHKPMPVDRLMNLGRGPEIIDARGTSAPQAHLFVMERHRGGTMELMHYRRSMRATPIAGFRQAMMRLLYGPCSGTNSYAGVFDTGGTTRSLTYAETGSASTQIMNGRLGSGNDQILVGYGTSATAATGTETNLLSGVQTMVSTPTYDDVNYYAFLTGSRVDTVGTTIRELGQYRKFWHTGNALGTFLADRTVVTAAVVAPLQTVAVTYVYT
jgi:hypothetical protein